MIRNALVAVLVSSAVVAQDDYALTGANVVRYYGRDGRLTAPQFRRFLADEVLARADADRCFPKGRPTLDEGEYESWWLNRAAVTGGPTQPFPGEDVGADELSAAANPVWVAISEHVIEHRLAQMRVVQAGTSIHAEQVDAFLIARASPPRGSKARLAVLDAVTSATGVVTLAEFERFFVADYLVGLDRDRSGMIDAWEWRHGLLADKVCTSDEAYAAFIALAEGRALVAVDGLASRLFEVIRPALKPVVLTLFGKGNEVWRGELLRGDGDRELPRSDLVRWLREAEKKGKESRITAAGIVLDPGPVLVEGKSVVDPTKATWVLQIRKDVRPPGVAAEPAVFRWAQDGNRVESLAVDGAFGLRRLGAIAGSWKHDWILAASWERSRVKSPTTPVDVDRREYYIGWAGTTIADWGPFTGHEVRVGLERDEDQRMDVTRNALVVDWYPDLGKERSRSGWWNDLAGEADSDPVLEYYYLPRISLDLGDYESNGATVAERESIALLELGVGLRFWGDLTLQSRLFGAAEIDDLGRSFAAQRTTLSYPIGDSDAVTITATYTSGRAAPLFASDETFSVGFGIRF